MIHQYAPWHSVGIRQTLRKLKTTANGLLEQEAKKRFQRVGPNLIFERSPTTPMWKLFLKALLSPIHGVVLAVGIASWVSSGPTLALLFLILLVTNAVLITLLSDQQSFIEQSVAATGNIASYLKRLWKPRASSSTQMRSPSDIVPGDIILLSTGDVVPADARVIESIDFYVDESTITGESYSQMKSTDTLESSAALFDRSNMIFSRSIVTRGNAVAAVTATGKDTVVGSISAQQQTQRKSTPVLIQELYHWYSVLMVGMLVTVGLGSILMASRGQYARDTFPTIVAILITAVPPWLFTAALTMIARARQRLLQKGVIVKQAVSTDTLGRVSVLCIDKTATLTTGALAVESIIDHAGNVYSSSQWNRPDRSSQQPIREMWKVLALCNDARAVSEPRHRGQYQKVFKGDMTDCAVAQAADSAGCVSTELERKFPRLAVFPFTAKMKWMATVHSDRLQKGIAFVYIKGAPERVLDLCTTIGLPDKTRQLTAVDREKITDIVRLYASRGLRVLAVAQRRYTQRHHAPLLPEDLHSCTWLGLVVLTDPLREESFQCVQQLRALGVRLLILTGDHPSSAEYIVSRLEISQEYPIVGNDITQCSDEQLLDVVKKHSVYARIEPDQKKRIVQALQASGEVVAMTGDGINDALAMKASDVGIAVSNATDITKDAADVIVKSDNLLSISLALMQGRWMVAALRTIALFFLFAVVSLSVLLVGSLLFGRLGVLSPWHIVWISLTIHTIPVIAFLFSAGDGSQRQASVHLLPNRAVLLTIVMACISGLINVFLLLWAESVFSAIVSRSFVWTVAAISPLGYLLPSRETIRAHGMRPVIVWILSVSIAVGLQTLALVDPWLRQQLNTSLLDPSMLWIIAVLVVSCWVLSGVVERLTSPPQRAENNTV